ncbi:MAG: VOC family protein [Halieaceae bacterium]|jgi:catechol 2,3-dioxygenase-like lactoylglutathione lyase family enzyme|nr:VOC family protein [Halieaceae bacterium]
MGQAQLKTQTNTPLRLDHLAIWVEDMERTTSFLTNIVGWKRHPMLVEVSADDPTTGGMEAVFIDGQGLWLEMILPTSPGPGQDILEEKGDGAIVEVNFEAVDEDYMNILQSMEELGVQMLAMDGSPLENGGRIQEGVRGNEDSHEAGQKIAYWPTDMSGGTTVEIYEKISGDDTSLLNIRDAQWQAQAHDPSAPRIDHVSIIVEDAEKTAAFYTDIMGLARKADKFDLGDESEELFGSFDAIWIDANGVWLELVQPTGPGPLMDILKEKGTGHPLEIIAEVDDIDAYYDLVKSRGVNMVTFDGTPLSDEEKAQLIPATGDRIAYFPQEVSCGMTIEVYERGPVETSALHRRDNSQQETR